MATSATSPLASPPASSAPTVTSPPTEHSSPSPNPSTNGNPPEPSPISPPPPPPPTPVASPPTDSPPPAPVELPPSSPPPPPPPAISPTHPATITPSPSPTPLTSSPPLPIQFTPPPPPSSPPPPPSLTPPVPSLPSDPPSSPPPPSSNPPLSSPSVPAHSSPPPPAPRSKPPVTQPLPPHISHQTPPSPNKPTGSPPLAAQPPKNSPSAPVQYPPTPSPYKNTTSSPSSAVSSLHPSSSSPGSFVSSSPSPTSAKSTADSLGPGKGRVPMGGIVAIGLVLGFVMLGVIGLLALYMSKRKIREFKHNGGHIVPSPFGSSPRSDSNLIVKTAVSSSTPFVRSTSGSGTLSPHSHGGLGQSRSWFTYQELYEATNGFSLEDLLGEGGFGCVYKGDLANGREVAVKQLKIGAIQGEREFQGDNRPVMDWAIRIKIVVGAARGIAYLHEDCHPRIIHRDIKSSNILLDDKFEARVADFGLAKLALDVDTHVSTRVMGTFGYMAPEYALSGKLTDKSDVYSFGVVLLELLIGRKPVDASQPLGDESLVEWARPLLSHALETGEADGLVDPMLEKKYVESELFLLIEASVACVRHSAAKRPGMGQVVRAFGGLSPSDLSNGMRVGQSEIYDSAQQSAEIRWFRRMAFGSQDYSTDYFSEAARNTGCPLNSKQTNQRPLYSTQHSQNDPSK